MFVEKVKIENFRNLKNQFFEPSKNINVIYGDNANGKTSIIESIYTLSNLKSFRTNKIDNLIKIDTTISKLSCDYYKNECRENLTLEINKNSKKYKKNSKDTKISDYLFSLFCIVFQPDDIYIINGPPSIRRDFIDKSIFYTDIDYINILKKYSYVLKNKNALLRSGSYENIEEWNKLIAKYSKIIIDKRIGYVDKINNNFVKYCDYISYKFEIGFSNYKNIDDIENYILFELSENIDSEFKYKKSIYGAHKHNIVFNLNNLDLKNYGSQGQKRSFILTTKSAQIDIYNELRNEIPILLLDDMASELDNYNIKYIVDLVNNFKGQTFITSTKDNILFKSENIKKFKVEDGFISSFT